MSPVSSWPRILSFTSRMLSVSFCIESFPYVPMLFISPFTPRTSAIALEAKLEMHRQYTRQRSFPAHFILMTYVILCYMCCLLPRGGTTCPGVGKSKTQLPSNCTADVNPFSTVSRAIQLQLGGSICLVI